MVNRLVKAVLFAVVLVPLAYAIPCTVGADAGFTCTASASGTSVLLWSASNVTLGSNIGTVSQPNLTNIGLTTDGKYSLEFDGLNGYDPLSGNGPFFSLQQQTPAGSFPGDFPDNDGLFYDQGDQVFFAVSPVSSPDVTHLGFLVQSIWNDDSFHYPSMGTVTLNVYGASPQFNRSSGSNEASAPSGAMTLLGSNALDLSTEQVSAPGLAAYIGVNTTTAILGFSISLDTADGQMNSFAIDTIDMGAAPAQDGGTAPEPGTILLVGGGLLALARRFRPAFRGALGG